MNWLVESENGDEEILIVKSKFNEYVNYYDTELTNKEIKDIFDKFGYVYYWCFSWEDLYFYNKYKAKFIS